MSAIVAIYQSIPPELWPLVLGPVAAGTVEILKRVLGVQKAAVVVHFMTATTATLLSVLPMLMVHAAKPPEFIAAYAASIYAAANFAYVIVKAMAPFWASVKAYEARKSARKAEQPVLQPAPVPASVSSTTGYSSPPVAAASTAEFDG